jgi:hypothetical protein
VPAQNPFTAEDEKLRRQTQRLQEELRKAKIITDVRNNWPRCWSPVKDLDKF